MDKCIEQPTRAPPRSVAGAVASHGHAAHPSAHEPAACRRAAPAPAPAAPRAAAPPRSRRQAERGSRGEREERLAHPEPLAVGAGPRLGGHPGAARRRASTWGAAQGSAKADPISDPDGVLDGN